MIVIQVDEHGRKRQSLLTSFVGTPFRDLVETAKQPLEMVRNQLPVIAGQVVEGVVDRPQRARPALLIEIATEALRTACRTGTDEIRQLALLALEFRYHCCPPAKKINCRLTFDPFASIHSLESARTTFWAVRHRRTPDVRRRPRPAPVTTDAYLLRPARFGPASARAGRSSAAGAWQPDRGDRHLVRAYRRRAIQRSRPRLGRQFPRIRARRPLQRDDLAPGSSGLRNSRGRLHPRDG